MSLFDKTITVKQITQVAGIVIVIIIVGVMIILPQLNKQKDLSLQSTKVAATTAVIPGSCDVEFNIPSPTPTPVSCAPCQFNAYVVWGAPVTSTNLGGPIIKSFASGVTYPTTPAMSIIKQSSNYTLPDCKLATVSYIAPPVIPTLSTTCQNPIEKGYLTTIMDTAHLTKPNGYISATVSNSSTSCDYTVGLVTYKAAGSNLNTQNYLQSEVKIIHHGEKNVLFAVRAPMNNYSDIGCYIDIEKPAVYLYPEKPTQVSVKVDANGYITKSIPEYGTGWNVKATPSGLIDGKFDYLFYEASLGQLDVPNEGWVVAAKDMDAWFDTNLPKLGLNKKEASQFKEYWNGRLTGRNYYEVTLLSDKFLTENLGLNINPRPDTVIRLDFHFKPVASKTDLKEPTIVTPQRKGFTVVEWGGTVEK